MVPECRQAGNISNSVHFEQPGAKVVRVTMATRAGDIEERSTCIGIWLRIIMATTNKNICAENPVANRRKRRNCPHRNCRDPVFFISAVRRWLLTAPLMLFAHVKALYLFSRFATVFVKQKLRWRRRENTNKKNAKILVIFSSQPFSVVVRALENRPLEIRDTLVGPFFPSN